MHLGLLEVLQLLEHLHVVSSFLPSIFLFSLHQILSRVSTNHSRIEYPSWLLVRRALPPRRTRWAATTVPQHDRQLITHPQHPSQAQLQALAPQPPTSTPNITSAKTSTPCAANAPTSARSRRQVNPPPLLLLSQLHQLTQTQHKAKALPSGTNSKPKSAVSLLTTKPSGAAPAATHGPKPTRKHVATRNLCCRMASSLASSWPCT
jgi:hypothetical protein